MLFSFLLAVLTELFLLRAECALAKARLTTFEDLLKKSADFLRTTSENSSWPSSVMSSPIMMRGRRLLESINSVLYPAGEEKPRPDRKTKAEKDAGGDASGREKARGSSAPRKARHPGATQKIYTPDETKDIYPRECPRCHCREFVRTRKYSLFQVLELVLKKIVTHYRVWECTCKGCGMHVRAEVPPEARWGFGPGFAAATAVLTLLGLTRRKLQAFYRMVGQIEISQGGIQKCLDRASAASEPLFMGALRQIRRVAVAFIDETKSRLFGPAGKVTHWLWAMVCPTLCVFMIQETRSAEAFARLIGDWAGILVSDGFVVYLKWAGKARQSCLAHLMRRAKKFEEDPSPEIAQGGRWIRSELGHLIEMTDSPPTKGQYAAWRGRFMRCVRKYSEFGGELGAYARHLQREADCIVTFLKYEGVDPTSNAVERALRPYVCRRKISFGQTSRHGEVDISRLLTLHETCRRNGRSTYEELKNALECHAKGKTPSLYWIRKAGMKSGATSPRNYAPNRLARPAEWYE
jgi:transposase